MLKNEYFARANHLRHSFPYLSFWLSVMVLLIGFSTNAFGQVAIPLSQLNLELPKYMQIDIEGIGVFDDQLYVNTHFQGLWILSEDGTRVMKVGEIKGIVDSMVAVGDKLFITSNKNELWLIDKGDYEIRVKEVSGVVHSVEVIGNQFFVGTDHGLWVVNSDGDQAKKIEQIKGGVGEIEALGDNLFVITDVGLWIVSKGGEQAKRIEDIEGNIYRIKRVGDELLVSAFTGLWVVSKDGEQARLVETIESSAHGIKDVGDQLFVGTDDGLWVLSKDGKQVNKVERIKGQIEDVVVVGKYAYVNVMTGQAILHTIYRIDPTVIINTKLTPSGWWATAIDYVLPSNWVPAEKLPVEAFYLGENSKDPYGKTIPREFRFAKADDDSIPSNDKFSPQEQFSYGIGWGKNDVRYWVKDKWDNAFEQKATYWGVPSQY